MATRLKVDKTKLLTAIDTAVKEIDAAKARRSKEAKEWDWRREARTAVKSVLKEADRRSATEKSFDSVWNNAKKGKPNHKHAIDNLEREKAEILDFKQLVEMSSDDSFTVSTEDFTVSKILHIVRNRKA